MKTAVVLFLGIAALAHASPMTDGSLDNDTDKSQSLQAIAGDVDLKTMMVEDGTPKGKCYCSCSLNNQPVFMEIDPSILPISVNL